MRKWVVLGALLVVLAGLALFAAANLNSYLNDNKEWIMAQAEATLGRSVRFDEIGVSITGGFGARVTNLQVADDPAFSQDDFVRAERVQVAVKILPALFGRYEVRRFLLERPQITLIRTAAGLNVDSIGRAAAGEEGRPPAGPADAEHRAASEGDADGAGGSGSDAGALSVVIAAMTVRDGELRFIDRTAPGAATGAGEFTARHFDFSASDVGFERPIKLEMAAALLEEEGRNFALEGTVGPIGDTLNVEQLPVNATINLDPLDIGALQRALPAVAESIPPELGLDGPLGISARVTGSVASLAVSDVSVAAEDAAITYGSTFTKPKGVPLRVDLDVERSADIIDVKSLTLRLASLGLKGAGKVNAAAPQSVDLQLDVERTPLDGWSRLVPALADYKLSGSFQGPVHVKGPVGDGRLPQLTGNLVLRDVALRGEGLPEIRDFSPTIELKGDTAVLPATTLTVGGSPVQLEATVERFQAPAVKFSLRSQELRPAALGLDPTGDGTEDNLRNLSMDGVLNAGGSTLDFRGSIQSGAGEVQRIDYEDLKVDLRLQNNVAIIESLSVNAFDGSYTGNGRYDMTNRDRPSFAFDSTVRAMEMGGLLGSRFPGAAKQIEGRLDADLSLTGAGAAWETIQDTLAGSGRAELKEGVLRGVNVGEAVLAGVTGIPGLSTLTPPGVQRKFPELFGGEDTPFDKCGGTVRIADGRVSTSDLALAAREYEVRGGGWFSFDNAVDFTATFVGSPRLSQSVVDDVSGAKYLADASGRLQIPFRFAGRLPGVRPRPDVGAIARTAQGALVTEGLGKLLGKTGRPAPSGDGQEKKQEAPATLFGIPLGVPADLLPGQEQRDVDKPKAGKKGKRRGKKQREAAQ